MCRTALWVEFALKFLNKIFSYVEKIKFGKQQEKENVKLNKNFHCLGASILHSLILKYETSPNIYKDIR